MISAVLFDLDGTLVDRDAASERWFRGLLQRRPDLFPDRPQALRRFLELDLRGYGDRGRFCHEVVDEFPGIATSPAHFWHDFTLGLAASVVAEPQVLAMLEAIASRKAVAILTNGSTRNQRAKLSAAGLSHVRAFVSEEMGFEKPDPQAFAFALEALSVQADGCLFVGDDPDRDVAGAEAAGLATCWVSHGRAWPRGDLRPDRVVSRVEEIAALEELRG
jgi:putative hydrolase of the HAD superfamily